MFGNINTDGIPSLYNYAAAEAWEAKVKPIRGRTPECKPLGERSRTQYSIRREGTLIYVRVHNTDVITYYPDGVILLNTGGWATDTTHKIMTAVLGYRISPHTFQSRTWITATNTEGVTGTYRLSEGITRLTQAPQGDGTYIIHNPETIWVHAVDRKAHNRVKARYAGFLSFFKTYIALRRTTVEENRSRRTVEVIPIDREGFTALNTGFYSTSIYLRRGAKGQHNELVNALMLSEDAEDHFKATLMLTMVNGGWLEHISVREVTKLVGQMILFMNRDEVLRQEALPPGKQSKDNYADFF